MEYLLILATKCVNTVLDQAKQLCDDCYVIFFQKTKSYLLIAVV